MEGGDVTPLRSSPIVIAVSLFTGEWRASNGPSNDSGHRRAVQAINGGICIAERFAIDWQKLGEDGRSWNGDRLKNTSYHSYGAEVLAVADGTVVEARDGIDDNVPGSTPPLTFETGLGNHVVLDVGQGHFVFYAHLQQGIRVKVGDHVRRARVLGLVGNSGASTAPHLHFQVIDSPSPLGSEGLPFVFGRFQQKKPNEIPVEGHATETRSIEIPMQNAVIQF